MGRYLIPANSKKSLLIFGFFTTTDLIIFGFGAVTTMLLLLMLNSNDIRLVALECVPLLISLFLVMPLPYYHNVRVFFGNIFGYLFSQRVFKWKGWCAKDVFGRDN